MLQDLFLDEPSHDAEPGGAAISLRSSLPPLFVAVSSLSGLTRPEERRVSTHARDRAEPPAEATSATAAAKDREHSSQVAAATAGAILAAASPKRSGGGPERGGLEAGRARGGAGQRRLRTGSCCPASLAGTSALVSLTLFDAQTPNPRSFLGFRPLSPSPSLSSSYTSSLFHFPVRICSTNGSNCFAFFTYSSFFIFLPQCLILYLDILLFPRLNAVI